MDDKDFEKFLNSKQSNIDWTIDNTLKRGYEEVILDIDDYSLLLEKHEFRNLIIFELYENFFLPQRHEFELQILTYIVDAVVEYKPWSYAAGAAASGVIGNTIYDLLKKLFSHVSAKYKDRDEVRSKIFSTLENEIDKIEKYFEIHESGKIDELEICLDIDRDRLVPLLKLLGFKCYKRKKSKLWVRPD